MVKLVPHAVQVHEAEVASRGTLLQRHEDVAEGGEEFLLGAVVEVDLNSVERGEAGVDVYVVELWERLQTRADDAVVAVGRQVERGGGVFFSDLAGCKGAAADEDDEVGEAVGHVAGLEGEGVAGCEHGVCFAVGAGVVGEGFGHAGV